MSLLPGYDYKVSSSSAVLAWTQGMSSVAGLPWKYKDDRIASILSSNENGLFKTSNVYSPKFNNGMWKHSFVNRFCVGQTQKERKKEVNIL